MDFFYSQVLGYLNEQVVWNVYKIPGHHIDTTGMRENIFRTVCKLPVKIGSSWNEANRSDADPSRAVVKILIAWYV